MAASRPRALFLGALLLGSAPLLADEPVLEFQRIGIPAYKLTVNQDRTMIYEGYVAVRVVGRETRKLGDQEYDSIVRALDEAGFWGMPPLYGTPTISVSNLRISASMNGRKNTVTGASFPAGWPRTLPPLMWAVEDLPQVKDLRCPVPFQTRSRGQADMCEEFRDGERKALEAMPR